MDKNPSELLQAAIKCHQEGNLDRAGYFYRKYLELDPENAEVMHLLAVVFRQQGNLPESAAMLGKAVNLQDPPSIRTMLDLAVTLQMLGRFEEVVSVCRDVLDITPESIDARVIMGGAWMKLGKPEKAAPIFKAALALNPDDPNVLNNLGLALAASGRPTPAIRQYERAIQLKPENFQAYNNLGNVFAGLDNFQRAAECYRRALDIKPDYFDSLVNMGNALRSLGETQGSIDAYRRAASVMPDNPDVYYNWGLVYGEAEELEKAAACFSKTLELNPDKIEALDNLDWMKRKMCFWERIESAKGRLDAFIHKGEHGGGAYHETPFRCMVRHPDPAKNLECARAKCLEIAGSLPQGKPLFKFVGIRDSKKITVGYLSCDFHDHPTAHLAAGMFKHHERDRFRVVGYSYGPDDQSGYRREIASGFDLFRDIGAVSDADAARLIYDDRVDILVDMKGHTQDNRLGICAMKPSPIQATWLGFPGTSGADFFDYIVTDKTVTPEEHLDYYSEKPVYMPHSYQVNHDLQPVSPKVFTRRELGLPEKGFVFCCFNNPYKIEPLVFDVWMSLLKEVPGSVLWLLGRRPEAVRNLKQEAAKRGITAERLIFAGIMPKDMHLARLASADLALDTYPVNGHTTSSDALRAGVPVVSFVGEHFASRVTASLLGAADLKDLAPSDMAGYERLAMELALDNGFMEKIREKLSGSSIIPPLFDTPLFVANLEKAYIKMQAARLSGRPPFIIDLTADLS